MNKRWFLGELRIVNFGSVESIADPALRATCSFEGRDCAIRFEPLRMRCFLAFAVPATSSDSKNFRCVDGAGWCFGMCGFLTSGAVALVLQNVTGPGSLCFFG